MLNDRSRKKNVIYPLSICVSGELNRGNREERRGIYWTLCKVPGCSRADPMLRPLNRYIAKGGGGGIYGGIPRRLTRSIISKLKGRWRSFTCTGNPSLVLWWANTMIPISDYNGDLYPVPQKHKLGAHIVHFSICRSTLIPKFTPVVKLE